MIDAYTHLDMSVAQPLTELERSMDAAGVDRALVVETWSGDNRACLHELVAASSDRFRIAMCFRPDEAQSCTELLSCEMVRALRVKTADLRRLGSLAADLQSGGKWLLPHAESGISALTEELLRIVALQPGLCVYLPHMGWPRRDRQDDDDWRASIRQLAQSGNLIVGVSAPAHFSRLAFPHEDVRPFAAELRVIFGPDLLVPGSDYPLFEKDKYTDYMKLAGSWISAGTNGERRFESSLFGNQLTTEQG
jgi:predicted TIM-barrel fold metal-dependent hydrolase